MSSSSSSSSPEKKRYVLVGTGGRSRMFMEALFGRFRERAQLLALCDVNQTRMNYHNRALQKDFGVAALPTYLAADFDTMIEEQKPDGVIVTTMDRTHHQYIIRAMELGCDVISEKPMTVDATKCRAILEAIERTGRKLRVTFNYRYAPTRTKVKELILSGAIGKVTSIHFEWLLDTKHGADYFRRWHRDKRNSGGLMVHKATHHFDLVNWWLGSTPETVFGFGSLAFYGKENAEQRGVKKFYRRGTDEPNAVGDPFALNLRDGGGFQGLYLEAEQEDGYQRDQSVFGDGISIEDTMNVLVRYQCGTQLSYSLTAYSPWEGLRIAFNGTEGRIELQEIEGSYVNAGGSSDQEGALGRTKLVLHKHWGLPEEIPMEIAKGGHGGGDDRMLEDIFGDGLKEDPYQRAATHIDGALSILTGIAANQSFCTGLPVCVKDLVEVR